MKYLMAAMMVVALSLSAQAHEEAGFNHLATPTTGPIIGQKRCGFVMIWFQDRDEDGTIDTCTHMMLVHDKIHVKYLPTNEEGVCDCER